MSGKVCGRCKLEKPFTDFYKNASRKDGYNFYCIVCIKSEYESKKEVITARRRASFPKRQLANQIKCREGYQKNKEARKAKIAEWKKANKPKVYESSRKRDLRIKQVSIYQISDKEIARLYAGPCFYCGSVENLQIDHVFPVSKGGRHSIGNLVTACRSCNASKNDTFLAVWRYLNERGKKWQL